jgi:G3E family GTPase
MDSARLDTMVTVVDAAQFQTLWHDNATLGMISIWLPAKETNEPLVHLLVDQIEFADVILLSKTDIATKDQLAFAEGLIKKLNPEAKVYHIKNGQIDLASVIDTGLFSMDKAARNAGWLKEIRGEHVPETEEYGISSFVYTVKKAV